MKRFIEHRPAWDQYRLMTSALAGFLIQNGIHDRDVTRCYLDGMFDRQPSEPGTTAMAAEAMDPNPNLELQQPHRRDSQRHGDSLDAAGSTS